MRLKNGRIVLENKILDHGSLVIDGAKITELSDQATNLSGIDLHNYWVLPGFIDLHVHGGYGVDFETGDQNRFHKFAQQVGREGVTKYLQSSVTNSVAFTDKIYEEFGVFMENQPPDGAVCVGAHLEGPFISPLRKGAHNVNFLMKPDIELTKQWQRLSRNNLKMVTYAADEQDGSYTRYLVTNGIVAAIGHTDMTSGEFKRDYLLGAKHITHLFNGMSGVDQYRPGLATAALSYTDVLCEVIADGIHIHPDLLKLIYKIKGPENICIITDAMNAKGLADGFYTLGSMTVAKDGMKITLKDGGNLAGSGATYDHNVRTYQQIANINMVDLIRMTSINAAQRLNIFNQTGSLAVNKLADIVVLDDNLEVKLTIAEGRIIYNNLIIDESLLK